MRDLLAVLAGIGGLIGGGLAGFFLPLFACVALDSMTNAPSGGGFVAVGWMVCFLTIPLFAIIGCVVGPVLVIRYVPREWPQSTAKAIAIGERSPGRAESRREKGV
jgi:hypothetical protein